jgi:hypothetical protein
MEMPVGPTEFPHPAGCMALSFTALVDQVAVAREVVQTVVIYTDGSQLDRWVGQEQLENVC